MIFYNFWARMMSYLSLCIGFCVSRCFKLKRIPKDFQEKDCPDQSNNSIHLVFSKFMKVYIVWALTPENLSLGFRQGIALR